MIIEREKALNLLREMPETFSFDELMERFFFLWKIETAMEQSKNNQVTPHEEVKKRFQQGRLTD